MPGAAGVVVDAVGAELRTPGWPAGTPAGGGGVGEAAVVGALCAASRSTTEPAGSGTA
jgi:hypothetical protein